MKKQRLLKLLKQPSTYAGFGVLAGVAGVTVDQWAEVANSLAAAAAVAAIFMDEGKP
jgi:hypothetical protein